MQFLIRVLFFNVFSLARANELLAQPLLGVSDVTKLRCFAAKKLFIHFSVLKNLHKAVTERKWTNKQLSIYGVYSRYTQHAFDYAQHPGTERSRSIVVQDETEKFGKEFCRLYINFCTFAELTTNRPKSAPI